MAPQVLERVKTLVEPALRAAVDTLDANLAVPTTYHLGWTDEDGNPATSDSGKGMRSALVVLGAEAVGATAESALAGAVAVELIHNFSLIHDDIMDNDRTRRHRRTVWDVYGVGDAIIVGDALHALAFQQLLRDVSDERAVAATDRLARATGAMIAGQAQDVALDRSASASLQQCLTMEANKTGALLAQSVAIGAVLGGGNDRTVDALEQFGAAIGIAFQAIDDVLGIWGNPARTGKPVGNDLRERKKSMPVAIAFDRGGDIADTVTAAFTSLPTESAIIELAGSLEQAGIRDEVEAIAADYLDRALTALDAADASPGAFDELVELARFVTARET